MIQNAIFGEELRRRRLAANLTLTQLGRMVSYSKSQLSKVERGLKEPSRELVRLCDAALHAEGGLMTLTRERTARASSDDPPRDTPYDEQDCRQAPSRRHLIGAGVALTSALRVSRDVPPAQLDEPELRESVGQPLFMYIRKALDNGQTFNGHDNGKGES